MNTKMEPAAAYEPAYLKSCERFGWTPTPADYHDWAGEQMIDCDEPDDFDAA